MDEVIAGSLASKRLLALLIAAVAALAVALTVAEAIVLPQINADTRRSA